MKDGLSGQVQQGARSCRRPGRTMRRSPSSSPTRWRRTSMAPAISARPAAPATSTTSCSSSAPTGGEFFDDDMKAQLASPAGIKTLREHARREQGLDPRQQRARRGVALGRVAAGQGGDDLFLAADRAHDARTIRRAPRRSTSSRNRRSPDKVGYAVVPRQSGARDRLQQGACGRFGQCRGRLSLHAMGGFAAGVAGARMLPYALRDPYRLSHYKSDLYRSLWPDAKAYLVNLNNSANVGLLDMIMPGWQDYALSIDRMCTSVWAGTDPEDGACKRPPPNGIRRRSGSATTARRRSSRNTRSCPAPPPTIRSRRWAWR